MKRGRVLYCYTHPVARDLLMSLNRARRAGSRSAFICHSHSHSAGFLNDKEAETARKRATTGWTNLALGWSPAGINHKD